MRVLQGIDPFSGFLLLKLENYVLFSFQFTIMHCFVLICHVKSILQQNTIPLLSSETNFLIFGFIWFLFCVTLCNLYLKNFCYIVQDVITDLTCSSVIQVQCQYDWLVSFTKNSLSALPFMGGGGGASGGASGGGGTGMGGGGSPHLQWRIFWTLPLIGGHCSIDTCTPQI